MQASLSVLLETNFRRTKVVIRIHLFFLLIKTVLSPSAEQAFARYGILNQ